MKEYRLGDLIEIKHGYAFDGEHIVQEDNGIVLVTPGNFRIGGGFQEDKCKFFTGEIPKDYVLSAGDFIVTMTDLSKTIDTLGYSALIPQSSRIYLHNQRIGLVAFKNNECYPGYIYYLMHTYLYQRTIANSSTGVTVHHTSPIKICDYTFKAPGYDVQKRISDCLFAYDDLIVNNQKQIKLLEEAAQRLYKEWFVDLHFPGYEDVAVVDGIPEGWKNGTLGEIAFFKRGKTITKDQTCEGFVPVVAGGLEPAYYHNKANAVAPVITVSGSGANAGFTRMYHTDIWASDCSFVDVKNTDNIYFAYCVLKNKKSDIDVLQKGAAQPHVYAKDINALEIFVPDPTCLAEFESFVTPFFEKIKSLYQQIELSKEARDRLLPKLMSGEIEV